MFGDLITDSGTYSKGVMVEGLKRPITINGGDIAHL